MTCGFHTSLLHPDHWVPVCKTAVFNAQWLSVILNDKHQRLFYSPPETTGCICSINNLCFQLDCIMRSAHATGAGQENPELTCNLSETPRGTEICEGTLNRGQKHLCTLDMIRKTHLNNLLKVWSFFINSYLHYSILTWIKWWFWEKPADTERVGDLQNKECVSTVGQERSRRRCTFSFTANTLNQFEKHISTNSQTI